MTRIIERAYRVADAIRLAGVKVVIGGPHATEVPDEALGEMEAHADAIALGEADETWPVIVEDAARHELKEELLFDDSITLACGSFQFSGRCFCKLGRAYHACPITHMDHSPEIVFQSLLMVLSMN
jgi:radical SAM superfamily enzyme YgiQ (UPF0313 family)